MDVTAISMAMENRIPVIVFDLRAPSSIKRAVMGESIGTIVSGERTG
jgi:uridylate kinase